MPRTINDICLLCKTRNSNKKNSHVISKFLGNKLFEGKSIRRAKAVNFEEGTITDDRTVQDTYKEDYILCSICEDKISIIESLVARSLHPIFKKITTSDFISKSNFENLKYWELVKIDPRVFHLFVYSLLWRASISIKSYPNIKCEPDNENQINVILNEYLKESSDELKAKLDDENISEFPYFPIILLIPSEEPTQGLNIVDIQKVGEGEYYFYLPDIHIRVTFSDFTLQDEVNTGEYRRIIVNSKNETIKLCEVKKDNWEKILLHYQEILKNGKENK